MSEPGSPPVDRSDRRWASWAAGLAVVPPALLVLLLFRHGIDVPYWDEWQLTRFFEADERGSLSLSSFWTQHIEHRLFFPRLLLFALGKVTDWNVSFEYALNVLVASIGFLAVWRLVSSYVPEGINRTSARVLASVSFFSLCQWENWTWGWQVAVFCCVAGLLWSIVLVKVDSPASLLGALFAAAIATFSFGNGLVVWPALFVSLLGRDRLWRAAVWFAVGLACWLTYFWDFSSRPQTAALPMKAEEVVRYLGYVSAFVGSPLVGWTGSGVLSCIVGSLGLAAAVFTFSSMRRAGLDSRWLISLTLFAVGSGFLTGIARYERGLEQALVSRYTSFSLLFWLGLAIALHGLLTERRGIGFVRTLVCVLWLLQLCATWQSASKFELQGELRSEALGAIRRGDYESPSLEFVHPRPEQLSQFLSSLESLEIGPYRHQETLESSGRVVFTEGQPVALSLLPRRIPVAAANGGELTHLAIDEERLRLTALVDPGVRALHVFFKSQLLKSVSLSEGAPREVALTLPRSEVTGLAGKGVRVYAEFVTEARALAARPARFERLGVRMTDGYLALSDSEGLKGEVDFVNASAARGGVVVHGWAFDTVTTDRVAAVWVFDGSRPLIRLRPNQPRNPSEIGLPGTAPRRLGFRFVVPEDLRDRLSSGQLQFVALSRRDSSLLLDETYSALPGSI